MAESAHPQPADAELAGAEPVGEVAKNPFPAQMMVPGLDGESVAVDLASVDGVLYAPGLDSLPIAPHVRHYVTQYCASWSGSVLTPEKLHGSWPMPPRRAAVPFREDQIHAMLGLAADESVVGAVYDQLTGGLTFIVDSPRLPAKQMWNVEPLAISLPVSVNYESGL